MIKILYWTEPGSLIHFINGLRLKHFLYFIVYVPSGFAHMQHEINPKKKNSPTEQAKKKRNSQKKRQKYFQFGTHTVSDSNCG